MDTQQAFDTLGLDPQASDAELKATWRRLAAAWHPDRNPAADAVQRMQAINKAYQHLRRWREAGGVGTAPDAPAPSTPPEETTAHTHVREVELTLEDAILGRVSTLRGHFTHACRACEGRGQVVLADACPTCRGQGKVRKPSLFGWLWTDEPCADCQGTGEQRETCSACEGQGKHTVAYRRKVRFPAGTRDGDTLTVQPTRHGEHDIALELRVRVAPHPLFTLDADGVLRCDMPVHGYAWMTGQWVEVPTPDGVQQMRLTRDALVYRLAGKGFPATPNGPRGDFLVRVEPVFPPLDDPAHQALLDELMAATRRAAEADDNQPLGQWKRRLRRWKAGGATTNP